MKESTACVFDIQHYSVHDGPGIRTVVFLKGCTLSCVWCCNPESQLPDPELMYNPKKCIGCGECIKKCPTGAIKENDGMYLFNKNLCTNCGYCVEKCYAQARVMCGRYMKMKEVMDELKKDLPFYMNSGGGVTLSGGEPLVNAEFVKKLFIECKQEGINTAVETCGNVAWENIYTILPYVDLFLFDIKHMSTKIHKKYTGCENKQILSNCRKLATTGKEIIIRVPVIPTFNDNEQDLSDIVHFAKEVGVKTINLLPYHHYGDHKYKLLMREYWKPDKDRDIGRFLESIKEKLENGKQKISVGA